MKAKLVHLYWKVSAWIEKTLFIQTDCAWCGKVLRRPLVRNSKRISHTMCRACAIENGLMQVSPE